MMLAFVITAEGVGINGYITVDIFMTVVVVVYYHKIKKTSSACLCFKW